MSLAAVAATFSVCAFAESDIETITITAQKSSIDTSTAEAVGDPINPDAASWLQAVPGAGINRNGAITGIAQYRGLFGDRVSVKMNGHHLIGSGPNAMDAPLSYATPILIESMTAYRGIAPVYVGVDSLGGAIDVQLKQAEIDTGISGNFLLNRKEQGNAQTLAGVLNVSNKNHAVLFYVNDQNSDDVEDASDRLIPSSFYDKQQWGMDYRTHLIDGVVGFSFHKTDTGASGTAALPMDINYIEAERIDVSGQHNLSNWQLEWALGYLDSDHGMDNHSHRANMMSSMYRLNTAAAESTDFKIKAITQTELGLLTIGTDGYFSEHESIITSGANPMFNVKNFYGVVDNRFGVYAHLETQSFGGDLATGIRVKHYQADADNVSHHMAMMNANIKQLQTAFNQADKKQTDTNYDFTVNWTKQVSEQSKFVLGGAIKQKAPSYQERYLWVPMQATGGLADGHTYIGNIELDSETAYQLNTGFSYTNNQLSISPNIFYQEIDNYIQGLPSTNMAANMVGTMMSGQPPLQFSNVDAKLYGMDMTMNYKISNELVLDGVFSYVRGERTDIDDNLYRLAAPNMKLNGRYFADNWQASLAWWLFAEQDKVSKLNNEQTGSGYGIVNASVHYFFAQASVEFGVNNLLDKAYREHITGTNRVMMSEVAQGEKLPGVGRDVYLTLNFSF